MRKWVVRGSTPMTWCSKCVGGRFICKQCDGFCIKYGKDQRGKQRYFCKACKKTRVESYTYQAYHEQTSGNVVKLLCEGMGIRSISRLLAISPGTALKRIVSASKKIIKPVTRMNAIYEVDELRTYIGNKKRLIWVACALDRKARQIIDFRIGPRTNKTLRFLIDKLEIGKAKRIYTDGLKNYRYIIPRAKHWVKQHGINMIERENLNMRLFMKRLNRKTICFSKSAVMMEHCLRLYFWGNAGIGKLINPPAMQRLSPAGR